MPVVISLDFEFRGGHLTGRCRAFCSLCGHRGTWAREPEASRQSRQHNETCGAARAEVDREQMDTAIGGAL